LASILHTPSNESCAKFFEASVLALEELHQVIAKNIVLAGYKEMQKL